MISVAQISFTLALRIYYSTYSKQYSGNNPYSATPIYDVFAMVSDAVILVGSITVILGYIHSYKARVTAAALFTIGATFHLIRNVWAIYLYCIDDPNQMSMANRNAFCRMSMVGSDLYGILFLYFFAADVLQSVGDRIRVRIFVHSALLSAVGFLNAANSFHDDTKFVSDIALVWISSVVGSGYLIIAIASLTVFLTFTVVFCGYMLTMSDAGDGITCNPSKLVRKALGFCLLTANGMIMTCPYIYIFITGRLNEIGMPSIHSLVYNMVALALFVYDLQYVQ